MNGKNLLILAAATAGLVGAAYFISKGRVPTDAAGVADQSPLYPGLSAKAGEIATIELRKGKSQTVLARDATGKGWVIQSKGGYPAKFDLVKPVVSGVVEALVPEAKTAKPELYGKLEVGDPLAEDAKSTLVTFKGADGKELASLIVGKRDWGQTPDPFSPPPPGKAKHFVRKNSEAQSYLAEAELEFQTDPLAFADKQVVELRNDKVRAAVVAKPDGEIVAVFRDKQEDPKYQIKDIPIGRSPKDEFAASRVAQALGSVTFDDVRPIGEVDFNAPEAITYEATCFDGTIVTVKTVSKDGKTWARFSARFEEAAPAETPTAEAAPAANATADVTKPAKGPEGDEGDAAKQAAAPKPDAAKTKEVQEAQKAIVESVKKDVAAWNAKWGNWAYALPQFKVDQLATKMEDLLAPKAPEQNPPSGAPAVPPSSLQGPG